VTLDELVNFKGKLPIEEKIENNATIEHPKLINELDAEDKQMVFRLIDAAITRKKFKDFFSTTTCTVKEAVSKGQPFSFTLCG